MAAGFALAADLERPGREALQAAFQDLTMPEKKGLFDGEVLPYGQPFIVDYRTTSSGVDAQIDRGKLRNFLKFSASAFGQGAGMSACLSVRSEEDCKPCESVRGYFRDALRSRLKNRGFAVKAGPEIESQLTAQSVLRGERAFEEFTGRTLQENCDVAVYAEVLRDPEGPAGSEPTALLRAPVFLEIRGKGDKRRVRTRAVGGLTTSSTPEPQSAKTLGPLIQAAVTRQLADLFNVEPSVAAIRGAERYVRLGEVEDFETYNRFKQAVADGLPSVRFEERLVTPGEFQFAIDGVQSLEALARQLRGLDWGGGRKLEIVRQDPDELYVILRQAGGR